MSFKKPSKSIYFPLNFHCVYTQELNNYSFILNDKPYNVPCIFEIYEKRDYHRSLLPKVLPNSNYFFIKKNEIRNLLSNKNVVAFKRVGGCAGKFLYDNLLDLSHESHYFIVFNTKIGINIKDKLNNLEFEHNNTTGPKSISKQELISQLNLNLK
jgi:hypothetical protein